MCTSLTYKDTAGNMYVGRTMELTVDLPYQVAWLPVGHELVSQVEGADPVRFTSRHGVLAITAPDRVPGKDTPITIADLKVVEGMNDKGLTFSLLAYPAAAGDQEALRARHSLLGASELGAWILGQFGTVAEVKAGLAAQPVVLVPLQLLGGVVSPFHYAVHDATGASLVIEFHRGEMNVYDNPVGVMTNGPTFPWHLTNLDNYTFLTNVDKSTGQFGGLKVAQPDAGIATAALPSSQTSVGRFVRAVYYSEFTEKAATPDAAMWTLAHVINNFDRPRGATIDYPEEGAATFEVKGLDDTSGGGYATEYTSWTCLSDLARRRLMVRDYQSINFTAFDLAKFSAMKTPAIVPLERLRSDVGDASDLLAGSRLA